MKIFSYFCPFSQKFNSCHEFKKLTGGQKALTIFVTVLSTIASIPLLGLGGVAAFRAMVEKYSFKKIDPHPSSGNNDQENATESEKTARKVHKFASLDDGMLGLNSKLKEKLYGSRAAIEIDDDLKKKPKASQKKLMPVQVSVSQEENKEKAAPEHQEPPIGAGKEEAATGHQLLQVEEIKQGNPEGSLKSEKVSEKIVLDSITSPEAAIGETPHFSAEQFAAHEVPALKTKIEPVAVKEEPESVVAPKKEEKPLDKLSNEEAKAYIKMIQEAIKNKQDGPKVLEEAHERFMGNAKSAVSKAKLLHDHFIKTFVFDKQLPFVDEETGMSYTSLFQLKTAIKMAREAFPGLTSLAFNEEQKIIVARLIQVIMCGPEATKLPLPEDSRCFKIQEIKDKKMKPEHFPLGIESGNTSYLDVFLENIQSNHHKKNQDEFLFDNINHAISLFVSDCINRNLNSFRSEEVVIPLGLKGKVNDDNPIAFIAEVNKSYSDYLLNHPDEVKKIIAKYQKSPVFKALKEKLAGDYDPGIFDDSSFPQVLLQKLLMPQIQNYQSKEKVLGNLIKILEDTVMHPEKVREIAKKSKCKEEDIEPLVRLKVLEMMFLMNQASQFDGICSLRKVVDTYSSLDEMPLLSVKGSSSEFDFSSSGGSSKGSFSDFSNRTTAEIRVAETEYASEGIQENFSDRVVVADVDIEDKMTQFLSSKAEKSIVPISELRLSWQASEQMMDHLVSKVDPDVVNEQPSKKYPAVLVQMSKSNDLLKEISVIQMGDVQQKGLLDKVGALFFSAPEKNPKLQDLKHLAGTVDNIIDTTKEYLKTIAMLEKPSAEVMPVLTEHKDNLVKAAGGLMKLKKAFEAKKDENSAEVVGAILTQLDNIVSCLPIEEDVAIEDGGKTYLERLYGVFSQSGDPKEIEWKVKKYESQILELKEHLKSHFEHVLTKEDTVQLEDSFVIVPEVDHSQVIKDLLGELNSVDINLEKGDRFNQSYLAKVRDVYNDKFMLKLRDSLLKEPSNPYLKELCEILFTKVNLEAECMDTLDLFDGMGAEMLEQKLDEVDPSSHGENPFVKRLNNLYQRLTSVPFSAKAPILSQWGNSARGQWNYDFDPYRQGNPVHVLYHLLIGEKMVKALGMGTPTIEDGSGVAKLTPEFIGFGQSYKNQGKKHLFVLNQNSIPKTGWLSLSWIINGDETSRCNVILDSQDREDLKGAIYCISLAKNSKFYDQKGPYLDADGAAGFKKELYQQVFVKPRSESGCYIPQSIRDQIPAFNARVEKMMDDIHTHLFQNKEVLTREERKLFIETYYDTLTKFLLKELDVDSFNISCKDAIDRGAGSNAQLFANCAIVNDEKGVISPKLQKKVEMLMMVRALLVRKRPPLPERVERFTEGLDHALSHAAELKGLHKATFGDLQVIPV